MKPAAEEMREKINSIKFSKPTKEILSNVTSNINSSPEDIKKLLIQQIYSTVRWRESIEKMYKNGVKNFVEIGPGKVLSGMVKRTIKNTNCFSINTITDIKNLINEL